jgi:hypothetical protein
MNADGRLAQIREVFVDSMVDHELHEEAAKANGALVSLTHEYRQELTDALGAMFDEAVAAHVAAAVAASGASDD